MRRWRGIITGGVLWAFAGTLFRVIVAMSLSLRSLAGSSMHSEFVWLLRADWVGLGKFLWPPAALGADIRW